MAQLQFPATVKILRPCFIDGKEYKKVGATVQIAKRTDYLVALGMEQIELVEPKGEDPDKGEKKDKK